MKWKPSAWLSDALSALLVRAVGIVLVFVSTTMLAGFLGPAEYGTYSAALGLAMLLATLAPLGTDRILSQTLACTFKSDSSNPPGTAIGDSAKAIAVPLHDNVNRRPADSVDGVYVFRIARGSVVRMEGCSSVSHDDPRATHFELPASVDRHADHRDLQSDVGRTDSVARSRDSGRTVLKHSRLEIFSVKHGRDLRHGIRINLCRVDFFWSPA